MRRVEPKNLETMGALEPVTWPYTLHEAQQRNRLLSSVTEALRYALNAADLGVAIRYALETLAITLGVDRAYVVTFVEATAAAQIAYGWTPWGEAAPLAAHPLYGDGFEYWRPSLAEGKSICGMSADFESPLKEILAAQGVHSLLMLPLRVGEQLWGCMRFDDCQTARTWNAGEIAALATVTSGLGRLLSWAAAERASQHRDQNLALMYRAAQAFSATLDLDAVLETILEEVRRLLGVVASSVWLIDRQTGELVCRQATGPQSDVVRAWRLPSGTGIAGQVVQIGESLIVPDVRIETQHYKDVDRKTGLQLRSILTMPLRVHQEVIGVLQVVDAEVNRFSSADLELLEPLAASAAIAIENAHLYGEAESLRALNESIVQGMAEGVMLLDDAGRITFANARCSELCGYPAGELLGQVWTAFLAPEARPVAPEPGARYESLLLTRQGERLPVLINLRPLAGRISGVLATFIDISERQHAEEVLKRRNAELLALNDIATTLGRALDLPHGAEAPVPLEAALEKMLAISELDAGWVHLLERDTRTLTLVAQRGLPPTLAAELSSVKVGDGFIGASAHLGQPIVLNEVGPKPYLGIEPGGFAGLYAFASMPMRSKDRVLGVLGVCHRTPRRLGAQDVQLLTAIANHIGIAVENARLANEASEIEILRELNRLRSELIANVSHELRTPLGLVKVFCTSLLMDDVDFDHETQLKFLHGIDEQTDRLEVIVDNLLDLSRVESGRLHLDKRPTNVTELIANVVAAMEADRISTTLLPETGENATHHFVLDFPAYPLHAAVDVRRVEQVLRNLIGNAIKYSPNGGAITVQVRGDKWQLLIRVSDQGIGIPSRDLERVFERFYRVENDVTYRTRGVGLGLSVCRGIVEAHGGRIWADSVLGVGSSFYFTLPVEEAGVA